MKAEQVTGPVCFHGEGPVWSPRWGGLCWVDLLAGDVLALSADGSVRRRHVATVAAALRPRRGGGAVIGVERGFALEDPEGSITRTIPAWSDASLRMNDGACDPDGRFYCGSMAYDGRAGAGALYRLDADLSVRVVLREVTTSNGLDWSPDGALAYFNDTATQQVSTFDYDREVGLTARRLFASIPLASGRPDGLTVDREGGVWVALYGGGAVWRFTPAGVLDAVVEVPTPQVTACALGGDRGDELYITTSRQGLEPGADPLAGSLFCVRVSVQGQPVREFAG